MAILNIQVLVLLQGFVKVLRLSVGGPQKARTLDNVFTRFGHSVCVWFNPRSWL